MSEPENIDLNRLAGMVRAKRGKTGLRDTGKEIDSVSAPTLSRIERGKMPDLATFLRICKWLNVSPESFYYGSENSPFQSEMKNASSQPAEAVEAFLRADRTLAPETVDALGKMIRMAYEHARQNKFGKQ